MTVVSVRCGGVQALQKRLISRTEEVVEVERILQEKDRLYLELRVVLERQPGPEVAQQISSYQKVGTHLPQAGYTLTTGWVHTYRRGVHTYHRVDTHHRVRAHLPHGRCTLTTWWVHTYRRVGAYLPEGGYTLTRGWMRIYQRAGGYLPEGGYTLTRGWVHTYQRVGTHLL